MRLVIVVWLAMLRIAFAQPATDDRSANYRLVVDRVELEPAAIGGNRLRLYVTGTALGGQLLDLSGDPKNVRLYVGQSEKKLPFALGRYEVSAGNETAIVVLVQATADFGDVLPTISDAIEHQLLDHLKDGTKIAIATYGSSVSPTKLTTAKLARGKTSIAIDGSAGDPALSDAIDHAISTLKKAKPEIEGHNLRKMIIVVGNGRDNALDKDRVTKTAQKAAKEAIRIHSIAYAPDEFRKTLLVLGEYSKQSFGTFRWPGQGRHPTTDSWQGAFSQLADEVNKQNVITFYAAADDDLAAKKIHLVTSGRYDATSNEIKTPAASECSGSACETFCSDDGTKTMCVAYGASHGGGGHILKWILIIAGGLVGVVVLLGVIGWAMSRNQTQAPPIQPGMMPPGYTSQPPQPGYSSQPPQAQKFTSQPPPMQGLLPNGRPIPGFLIMSGNRTGERLVLKNGFLIGSQAAADLQIQDGYTSTNHAQFIMDPEGNCTILDLGSTNGTFINGQRIQQQALTHGMTIKVGATELRFLTQ
ncbi:MAG: FHA domain-containing protein [Kofleriaceae bacterium]